MGRQKHSLLLLNSIHIILIPITLFLHNVVTSKIIFADKLKVLDVDEAEGGSPAAPLTAADWAAHPSGDLRGLASQCAHQPPCPPQLEDAGLASGKSW